jgi:hypothetical protein
MSYYSSSFKKAADAGEADYFDDAFQDFAEDPSAACPEFCEEQAATHLYELQSGALRLPAAHRASS